MTPRARARTPLRGWLRCLGPLLAGAAALPAGGCHGYLVPFDERAVAARGPVETAGGERLDLDARGDLVIRPARGDLSAALGGGLHPDPRGLLVTHRLRADTALQPEDVIVHAAAALDRDAGQSVIQAHERSLSSSTRGPGDVEDGGGGPGSTVREVAGPALEESWRRLRDFDVFDPGVTTGVGPASPADALARKAPRVSALAPPPASPADLRALPHAHPVRGSADLEGYLAAAGWLSLDLVVLRSGAETVVRVGLREPIEWQPLRAWSPERTRWEGLDLARVDDLPPARRPAHAEPGDLLVLRVARDAPAAREGLRPLQVIAPPVEEARTLGWGPGFARREGDLLRIAVRRPTGGLDQLDVPRRARPTQLWFPFLFSYQSDGARTHLGIGPLDLLYHYSNRLEYVPTLDAYAETYRWAVGTSIQNAGTRTPRGTVETGGLNLFLDGARMDYVLDWLAAADEDGDRGGGW